MGFLDKLLREGGKALGNVVADTLMNDKGEVGKTLREVKSAVDVFGRADSGQPTTATRNTDEEEWDDREFDEKLRDVIDRIGNGEYEIVQNIAPEELERRCGAEIYTRKGTHAKPDKITYELTRFGATVLYIRLWYSYSDYNHESNREIKRYCDSHGVKMLDFFDYLPNEVIYMENRIKENIN